MNKSDIDKKEITALEKNVEIILPENCIKDKISLAKKENRPLRIKLGFDPTSPDLHLGHAVVLRKLKEFQNLGHDIIVIVGDFTASIGDPTGKNKTRPPLTSSEIKTNSETYIKQLGKILNISDVKIENNSKWFNKMDFTDVIKLMSSYTLGKIMAREDFKTRFEDKNSSIALHEIIYPLLQGYDSVMVKSDIEIGGTDQLFNNMVGRDLQEQNGTLAQGVLCMPLLVGLDGVKKMSKSLKNYIGIQDTPNDIYGKTMSIPDSLLVNYIDLTTNWSGEEKESAKKLVNVEPMNIKKKVAFNLVEIYHGKDDAISAFEYFSQQFQKRDGNLLYKDVRLLRQSFLTDEVLLSDILLTLKIRNSKSDCVRLIKQSAVEIEGVKVLDPKHKINLAKVENFKLKCGKIDFYKIILN